MIAPWRILYTQSRHEFNVEHQLSLLGIEHYLPKLKVLRCWSDRNKWVQVPAFPSYIFVNPGEKRRNDVFYAKGVLHYLRTESRDAMVSEEEIVMIRKSEACISEPTLQSVQWEKGQSVKIVSGPLSGHLGKLIDFNGMKKVQLALQDIDLGFSVEIPVSQLQVI